MGEGYVFTGICPRRGEGVTHARTGCPSLLLPSLPWPGQGYPSLTLPPSDEDRGTPPSCFPPSPGQDRGIHPLPSLPLARIGVPLPFLPPVRQDRVPLPPPTTPAKTNPPLLPRTGQDQNGCAVRVICLLRSRRGTIL